MKKIIYITFILLCNMGVTKAQVCDEHLIPVGGIYDIYNFQFEYYSKVRKVLFNGLSDSPEIRFLVLPSFMPENVLDIEFDRDNNKYYIIYHICEQKIWENKDWKNVKVNKFKAEIDKKSVDLIKSLFSIAINKVKYPPAVKEGEEVAERLDGVVFYFTYRDVGLRSGAAHSPDKETKMGKLVGIGYKLIKLAKSEKGIVKFDEKLQKEIEVLINELK